MERQENKNKIKNKIIAVIPAYNEEKYISQIVKETKKLVDKVIVVNDASTDMTGGLAKNAGALVLNHKINLGLGSSLKTGCDKALKLEAGIIVTLDGDGQHSPKEIPKLIKPILDNKTDAVFGQREFNKNMPLTKKFGNKFFEIFSKKIFGIKVKDTQTGFRAFTSDAYRKIRWKSRDYAVASEMLINAEKNHINYKGQEIKTIYHDNYKGTSIIDGFKILNKMLMLKLNGR